ncbi:hypothetical protein Nepgr_029604 [Nepenthes gracilis]|uniref:Uncharacterized protein n=1 Tax=Nepenthes gracilis TaxID=150966 RepID=A0AAD3TEL4_NEPGR|nr:hypothetical protein Nepgr_029604 [Nepenthes gracilis]
MDLHHDTIFSDVSRSVRRDTGSSPFVQMDGIFGSLKFRNRTDEFVFVEQEEELRCDCRLATDLVDGNRLFSESLSTSTGCRKRECDLTAEHYGAELWIWSHFTSALFVAFSHSSRTSGPSSRFT